MSKQEFLIGLENALRNNIGSKLTEELASGFYGTVKQMLDTLSLEKEENKNGESKNS